MRPHFALIFLASACAVDASSPPPNPGDGPDAGVVIRPPDAPGGDGLMCAQAAAPPNGHHNAGNACLSCHTGAGAPKWTVAGTLYADSAGSAPVAGATVTLVDAMGKTVTIVTASNGNFWTSTAMTLPVHPKVSKCPSSAAMTGIAGGDCNGCHANGASQGRIKLP